MTLASIPKASQKEKQGLEWNENFEFGNKTSLSLYHVRHVLQGTEQLVPGRYDYGILLWTWVLFRT